MFNRVFSTKVNAAANFAGSFWMALLGLIFVPTYLRYIGVEAYGLIGIFNSIIAFIMLLDFGLSPTLNRELARYSDQPGTSQEMHDLKRTLENVNWASAVGIACFFCLAAPLIARYWIQPKDLTVTTVTESLLIMSANIALQFVINFYAGGLMGLRKQVLLSTITIVCATLRFGGALAVLRFYSPTVQAFLAWQGIVFVIQVMLMAFTLRSSMPRGVIGHFRSEMIRRVGRFAAGVTGITVVSLILTQTDKIVLSKMLSLQAFGYYTLATTVAAMSINMIVNSISHAVYPQFSRFVAAGDEAGLVHFYHHSCQILSVCVFPIIALLGLFSSEILTVWTADPVIAENTYLLLTVIAVGVGMNGLIWLPYYLQLAHGWTRLTFYVNGAAIIILVPMMVFGISSYGAVGGALAWLVLNIAYLLVVPWLVHRRVLKGEAPRWFLHDILLPAAGVTTVAFLGKMLIVANVPRVMLAFEIALVGAASLLVGASLTPATRNFLKPATLRSLFTARIRAQE
jgi:O-antigen/teichoic acid export membrane protein